MTTQIKLAVAISEPNPLYFRLRSALEVPGESGPNRHEGHSIVRPGEIRYASIDANHSIKVLENSAAFTATALSRPTTGDASKGTLQNIGPDPVTGALAALNAVTTPSFVPLPNQQFQVSIAGTFTATVILEKLIAGTWTAVIGASWTAPTTALFTETAANVQYRLKVSAYTSGTANVGLAVMSGSNATATPYSTALAAARVINANYDQNFSQKYYGQPDPYPPPLPADVAGASTTLVVDTPSNFARVLPGNYILITGA